MDVKVTAGETDGVGDDDELLRLVDEGRFDELHELVSVEQIADAWLAHTGRRADEIGWAVALWYEEPDETRRRTMLAKLVERAEDEQLASVAAGPLDAFATDDESRLAWIERQSARSMRFRRTLAMIWAEDLPDRAFARLERAAEVELPRSDRARYARRSRTHDQRRPTEDGSAR